MDNKNEANSKKIIEIPEFCLVALIGASSSGKTTFASKHFLPTEVLSSDYFRSLICDDENNLEISKDAFDTLYFVANQRLKNMKLTVIDATSVQKYAREQIIDKAKEYDCHAVAIVLNLPEKELQERNKNRNDRGFDNRVITKHFLELKRSLKNLKREGFRYIYVLNSVNDIENVEIVRTKLWNDKKHLTGPFDIIGDVHGCFDELKELLKQLGYTKKRTDGYFHKNGRTAVFLGDIMDRGPKNIEVLKLIMDMVESGNAICINGNHDEKLNKYLRGSNVTQSHGLADTIKEIESEGEDFKLKAKDFIGSLRSHFVLDSGKLVVSHAGIIEKYQGRGSARVRHFCLYGDVNGERDEYGLPVRLDWAMDYRGKATVVYGHTPQIEPYIINNTYCIDTGCVFGGKLTALRYPEREIVSIEAKKVYSEPSKPLDACIKSSSNNDDIADDVLRIDDVSGRMIVDTFLIPNITIAEENSTSALEVMSRFAVDPKWLIYLPPTMSPCETSTQEDYLEYPTEAFEYYRKNGVKKVVCEKKHMGSRAVIILTKDSETAKKRFGVLDNKQGVIYTRTGRCFFEDELLEETLIKKLSNQLIKTNFWQDLNTDWVCLDAELMPWSVKAQALIEKQYAPVGISGKEGLTKAVSALSLAVERGYEQAEVSNITSGKNVDLSKVLENYKQKAVAIEKYTDAYREYCWQVTNINDIRIAPFHILASEKAVHHNKSHLWHMETIKKYCVDDSLFIATDYIVVDTNNIKSIEKGINWWLELTKSGGEGMVVKPFEFVAKNGTKLIQPAVKCRGKEYLRIIYGPEYTLPQHLNRLKQRGLNKKRSLALREFSLGLEGLKRFTENAPLYKVHQCAFAVLALESEPVDPRL